MNEVVLSRPARHLPARRDAGVHRATTSQAGGTGAFSDYYTAAYDHVILRPSLREHVVFAQHNLVTDGSFNEFHVILCRNVMIYFTGRCRSRVHDLLSRSLAHFGLLGLGSQESLRLSRRREPTTSRSTRREAVQEGTDGATSSS